MGLRHPAPQAAGATDPATARASVGRSAAGLCRGALVALTLLAGPGFAETVEQTGVYRWDRAEPGFGGLSAIEVEDGGEAFLALTDSGTLYSGRIVREGGVVSAIEVDEVRALTDRAGAPVEGEESDAEGLAMSPEGRVWVSFEGRHRVEELSQGGPDELPAPRDFAGLQQNSGIEALAVDADGRLLAIPERSGALQRPFPVYRYDPASGRWSIPFRLARAGEFLPTGADVGPDGRLYLVERAFYGVLGFASRVRVFDIGGGGVLDGDTLIETPRGERDNLEGISVWRDGAGGLRLTLISDDNFMPLQRTEVVEYRLLP